MKKLNLKNIPKFNWRIDPQARYAAKIDKVFNNLKKDGLPD